jgi:peptidoglycan/LPS O-acetylase OafA/YrhL
MITTAHTDPRRREIRTTGRFDSLDGIRTLAVLAVMIYHMVPAAVRGGGMGVDVFFTLSGFVITRLLLREHKAKGRINLSRFYALRMSRLWPALFAVCAVVAGMALILPSSFWGGEQSNALTSALHLMNFFRGGWFPDSGDGGSLGHTWSLAVEEQFYLLWPVILIVMLRYVRSLGTVAILTATACIAVAAERAILQVLGAGYQRIYNGPDTRADQLLIGCLLAMVLSLISESGSRAELAAKFSRRALWPSAAVIGTGLLTLAYPHGDDMMSIIYRSAFPLVIALSASALICGLVLNTGHPLSKVLSVSWLSWPGKHLSYGMYLWHYPIFFLLRGLYDGPGSTLVRLPVGIAITLVVAYLSARYLEEPVRTAIRNRIARNDASAAKAKAA